MGDLVGDLVGALVGPAVGDEVGDEVGEAVGLTVGLPVGLRDEGGDSVVSNITSTTAASESMEVKWTFRGVPELSKLSITNISPICNAATFHDN